MPPVIEAKDLYKCYPGFAPVLKGASIQVEAGEMAAIMGPSGCGKSTMLHILGMLHAPDSGTLEILGTNVLALNREQTAAFRRGNMGFVMQASNLFEHSTVFENVEFPLIYENVPPQERWERVIRALDLVHLSNRVHYRSNRLSGGEQQRVAIARAMVNNPRILLADEPTGALDAKTSRLIMENFRKLCHEGGVSMIMVTHDPKMADYCDSIYTLEEGLLHCKKHEPTPFSTKTGVNFLAAPDPVVRGALLVDAFPDKRETAFTRLANRLHGAELLSRIYSTRGAPFSGTQQTYVLPLPVRYAGFWHRMASRLKFLCHMAGSAPMWKIWPLLKRGPKLGFWRKVRAFSNASTIAAWASQDQIQFLYAAPGTELALAAWAASKVSGLPYAFSVTAKSLPDFSQAWEVFCADSAFVNCADQSVLNALERQLPRIPKDKFLLLRPLPPILPEEDNSGELSASQEKLIKILCMGSTTSAHGYALALSMAAILKRMNAAFQLTVLGDTSWRQKTAVRRQGLKDHVQFPAAETESGLAEIFRNSDIFIAYPPTWKGAELALPSYICSAMSFGLAILVTDMTPGIAEALHPDKNSLLLPSGNASELAEKIMELFSQPERMRALGQAAKEDFKRLLDSAGETTLLADRIVLACAPSKSQKN